MEITFHLVWDFYVVSHVQTVRCSGIARIGVGKAYPNCTLQRLDWHKGRRTMPLGFTGLWQAIRLLTPKVRKCHLPSVAYAAWTRLITARADDLRVVMGTWREELWLALVQLHNRKSSENQSFGAFVAALPLVWILTCSLPWCCAGDMVWTLNNLLAIYCAYLEQYAGQ